MQIAPRFHLKAMLPNWWPEIRDLFAFADQSFQDLQGQCACFELAVEGAEVDAGDSILVRVRVLQQLEGTVVEHGVTVSRTSLPGSKAVLRLPYAMWNQVGCHCTTLRALWTQVRVQQDIVILDATKGHSFIAGDALLRQQEDVKVAEIFCGGFAGWTQAAWSLSDQGVRIRTSWLMDVDDDTIPSLRAQMPDLQIASTAVDVLEVDPADGPVLLPANIEHPWWYKIWSVIVPHILVCSPPCQPWSDAGNGAGLECADGRLLLLLASILKVVRTPVVCLEQVAGFARHKDAPVVFQAWREAGYRKLYEETLQLAEVAPTRRPRCMYVFVHESVAPEQEAHFRRTMWQAVRRPTLGAMRAVFQDLPVQLSRTCELTAELLQVYLDPWYLPIGAGSTVDAARKYRLCTTNQQAKCFMACYHRQHELPQGMLTKGGILCSLLHDASRIRFFASPEIASCHGAQRAQLLPHDDAIAMRLLGNSLAVPQAMLTLAHAMQLFPQGNGMDPAFAVHHCIQTRLHAGNSAIFFLPEGWLLVGRSVLGDLLAHQAIRSQLEVGMANCMPIFHELQVRGSTCGASSEVLLRRVRFSSHIATCELFEALQLEVEKFAPEPQHSDVANMRVVAHVSALGPLRFDANPCVRAQCGAPLLLCTSAGLFAVQPQKTDFYHQLKWVFDQCRRPDQPAVICLSCFGEKLDDVAAFPQVAFVAGSAADIFFHQPRLDETHVQACQVEDAYPRLRFQVPEAYAQNWWVQMPYHLFECLGWTAEVADPPRSTDDHMQVDLQPASETPLVPPAGLKLYLRELLFQSQLLALPKDARELLVGPFQIQVDARSVCTASLPQQTTISTIERLWKNACDMVGTWPGCRIFSGPRPLAQDASVAALLRTKSLHIKCSTALPLITVMPEVRGGGAKDENTALAKTKLASLMLERGIPLEETQASVDQVVPALGTAACLHALRQTGTQAQWQQLSVAAQAKGHQLPVGDNRTEKAAQRIQKAVRKQKLAQTRPVRAAEFKLVPDVWCGMGEQPVAVLDELTADSSGAVLLDASEANPQDLALLRNIGSEALCVIVPGHRCPDPDSCSGRTSVPVYCRQTGQRHLLAACYHNVGDTDIAPRFQHGTQVDAEETVCCSFTMCQEDFGHSGQWRDIAAAPVRSVIEAFRARGVEGALHHPWARSYRAEGEGELATPVRYFRFLCQGPPGNAERHATAKWLQQGLCCAPLLGPPAAGRMVRCLVGSVSSGGRKTGLACAGTTRLGAWQE